MSDQARVLKRLSQVPFGEHCAVAIWQEEDVLGRAEELGFECNQEQAREIIDTIDNEHNAELGITWDTIDHHIKEELKTKESK